MNPDDISGFSLDNGADLAINPPDVQINVAPSSFNIGDNYTVTDPTVGNIAYNPQGVPLGQFGTDGTLCTLANQQGLPTGTEDAIAYSADFGAGAPSYTAGGLSPTDITNTTLGGPVDANSSGSQPTDASSGTDQPALHGLQDAITGTAGVNALFQNALGAFRYLQPSLSAQHRGGAPMVATKLRPGATIPQAPQPGPSPALLALVIGGIGFILVGAFA